jgi:hypothetical protein
LIKLAFTSDLHLPITPATAIVDLAGDIAAFKPDALAVLGDIGESPGHIKNCLNILKDLVPCPILVVAGNHDLWLPSDSPYQGDSLDLFRQKLPDLVKSIDCVWLEGKAHVLHGVALVGTIAWYDYSAADPSIQATPEVFARLKGQFNMDAERIRWRCSDPEFAELVAKPFLETLDRLEADPSIHRTVVFTHVPLLDCQMCRKPNDATWSLSNAYFGNLTLGEKVIQRKKVTHIISGHTHVGRHAIVRLTDGRTLEARVLDSQYGKPVWVGIELEGTIS